MKRLSEAAILRDKFVPQQASMKPKKLSEAAILRDKFVPQHLKVINLSQVQARWVLCNDGILNADGSPNDMNMDPIIARMAENFIPRVPCICGGTPGSAPFHGPAYYSPLPVHRVPPDFVYALREVNNNNMNRHFPQADLDETTSIQEYSTTFRNALRVENEERMNLYEKYSLFKWPLRRLQKRENVASIHVEGISDARPSLQEGDIVLLRPIRHVFQLRPRWNGTMDAQPYAVEIESRVINIVRGKGNVPDQVIISWELSPEQRDELKDHAWIREYNIRFIPNSSAVEKCLTALDWLENLSEFQQEGLKDILFPVSAPVVKALTAEQRQVSPGASTANSDIGKPLNELQSSFVRMVRARTLDPSFEMTRPPMILTGPAGTGKVRMA